MGAYLYIPWFKLDQWDVPLPHLVGIVLALSALAALNPKWRSSALSTVVTACGAAAVAWFFFDVQEVPIQPFGVLVATGVLLGTRVAEHQAEKRGIDRAYLADFITHVIVIGFVSCYFLNGLFYERDALMEILADPRKLFEKWLGLSSFGGFIGAAFAVWVWKKRRKLPALHLADLCCWVFPLGWIFGRMGCFVVHDHPGAQTTFFLGVENWGGQEGVIRHDLGFYEVLFSIVVFAVFWRLRDRRDLPTGFFCAVLPLVYTPFRFGLDFLRATDVSNPDTRYLGLTPGHYASIGFFVFAVLFLMHVRRQGVLEVPEEMRLKKGEGDEDGAKDGEGAEDGDERPEPKKKTSSSSKKKKRKKK